MNKIKIGIIGTGTYCSAAINYSLSNINNIIIDSICSINDNDNNNIDKIVNFIQEKCHYSPNKFCGVDQINNMLEKDEIKIIFIFTDFKTHADLSVKCMLKGKHVACALHTGLTIEDCLKVISAKEKSGKEYVLLEDKMYQKDVIIVNNIIKNGLLGDISYGEGSYAHDCKNLLFKNNEELSWRGKCHTDIIGCIYPAHALSPLYKIMNLKKDRMKSIITISNKSKTLKEFIEKRFKKEDAVSKINFKSGDTILSFIKTENDLLILLKYDIISNAPPRNYFSCLGTKGMYDSRFGIYINNTPFDSHVYSDINKYNNYVSEIWEKNEENNSQNYFIKMFKDFINLIIAKELNEEYNFWGLDIYDASCITSIIECSYKSIINNSISVEIPVFYDKRDI
jgi:hypothetical protein